MGKFLNWNASSCWFIINNRVIIAKYPKIKTQFHCFQT